MDRFIIGDDPEGMIVPYTFSFPLIRRAGMPALMGGDDPCRRLTGSIYTLAFEYLAPPMM